MVAKRRRAVHLSETRAQRDKRVAEYLAGERVAESEADEGPVRSLMGKSGVVLNAQGPKKRKRTNAKRGTKICPMCNIELASCAHRPKVGRPKNSEPMQKAHAWIPDSEIRFLARSGLKISDVLEAVLDSNAVKCWRKHARTTTTDSRFTEELDESAKPVWDPDISKFVQPTKEVPVTAYTREYDRKERQRSTGLYRVGRGGSLHNSPEVAHFLNELAPLSASKRCDQLVPRRLLQLAEHFGKLHRGHGGKYSRTRFLSWAITYYADCVAQSRGLSFTSFPGGDREYAVDKLIVSRQERAAVAAIAKRCFWCDHASGVEQQRKTLQNIPRRARTVEDLT